MSYERMKEKETELKAKVKALPEAAKNGTPTRTRSTA